MTYSLVISPALVARLYRIREKTGVSIRRQILLAVESRVNRSERKCAAPKSECTTKLLKAKIQKSVR